MRSVVVAAVGWLAVLGSHYCAVPLWSVSAVLGVVVDAACWLLAVIASVVAAVAWLSRGRRAWAAGCLAVAVAFGAVVWRVDWTAAYVDSQVRWHHVALADLAARYRTGDLTGDVELPSTLRYLSYDGAAHAYREALVIPVSRDWRGETGTAIAYFARRPRPHTVVPTAPGDLGEPVRLVRDGWWWVA